MFSYVGMLEAAQLARMVRKWGEGPGVDPELRGWRWDRPPVEPPSRGHPLGIADVTSRYCRTMRDLYLRFVQGLELKPVTHPNDLFAGEAAEFVFLLDGKPAADVEISVIPGGNRYRDELGEMKAKTDKDGKVSITWPEAGMYWMEAELTTDNGVSKPATERRASYSATLEVLAP